jgi:hypothetical protein
VFRFSFQMIMIGFCVPSNSHFGSFPQLRDLMSAI